MRVRIVSPAPGDTLLGRSDIVIEASPPDHGTILKVEIYADDRLVATLLDPPYRLTWDAGDSTRARTIRVRAYASDGTIASDRVTTRELRGVQHARVTLVEVYCTVRDGQGRYIMNLGKDDFTVLESGVPQPIAVFSADRKPVHLVLLFDASNSMAGEGKLTTAQEAAIGFVEALEPGDTAALITFNDTPVLLEKPTADKQALEEAIMSIEAKGGTALYDSIMAAVDQVKGVEGRKAIILLSDGRDESVDGLGPGSITTFEESLDAILRTETAVYAVGTGDHLEEEKDYYHRRTLGEILGTLADRSGGRAWFVRKASKLKGAYRAIEDELRHQYTLAYYPPAEAPSTKRHDPSGRDWRPIEVRVSRSRSRVTARAGYYAR